MTEPKAPPGRAGERARIERVKQERLATALRANLHRRKAQARERSSDDADVPASEASETPERA
jgi:hypothetical protein